MAKLVWLKGSMQGRPLARSPAQQLHLFWEACQGPGVRGGAVDCPAILLGRCKAQQQAGRSLMSVPWQEPHIIFAQSCNTVREAVTCLPP